MSGNGRGATRPQGRSPPFLVIGLLVALGILAFNYWSLSASNGQLSLEKTDLQDQIRILTSRKLSEEQGKRDVERKYQLLEQRIALKDSEIKHLQEEGDKKQADVEGADNAKKECTVNLQTCETNNLGIQQQLTDVNQQLEELKKQTPAPTQNCDSSCKEAIKNAYSDILKKAGASVMTQIVNSGIEIGEELKVEMQQAVQGQNQIAPPDPNKQAQESVQKEQSQNPAQQQAQAPGQPLQPDPKDSPAGAEGKKPKTEGLINSPLGSLRDKLQNIHSLSQQKINMGLQSLSSGANVHGILNQTQEGIKEGIKEGLKKSKQLVDLIYGEGNLHASNETAHDTKNTTLVGDDKDNKPAENKAEEPKQDKETNDIQKPGDDNTKPEDVKKAQTTPKETNNIADEKDDGNADDDNDAGYEDDDDQVEDNKGATDLKKKGDSIDDLQKNLNKGSQ